MRNYSKGSNNRNKFEGRMNNLGTFFFTRARKMETLVGIDRGRVKKGSVRGAESLLWKMDGDGIFSER